MTGILFSRWAGSLVDKKRKLTTVRSSIIVQKTSALAAYACFAGMRSLAAQNDPPTDSRFSIPSLLLFSCLVVAACALHLSSTCISIAIERDWATCISLGPNASVKLAKLNTYLRQTNLLCKLLAPLFVSFLTVTYDNSGPNHQFSVTVLAIISIVTMVFELYWIEIVYRRFPALAAEQLRKDRVAETAEDSSVSSAPSLPQPSQRLFLGRVSDRIKIALSFADWQEFARLPVFLSSVAVSLLYLTVLS